MIILRSRQKNISRKEEKTINSLILGWNFGYKLIVKDS